MKPQFVTYIGDIHIRLFLRDSFQLWYMQKDLFYIIILSPVEYDLIYNWKQHCLLVPSSFDFNIYPKSKEI